MALNFSFMVNLTCGNESEQKSLIIQFDLLNVLYGCKMALRTLDFSQVKQTIAMLRERRARAPEAVRARFHWCDRKARCACFAVTHPRYYVVVGPWKQRSFHQYSYYRAISVTHSVIMATRLKMHIFTFFDCHCTGLATICHISSV